MPRSSGLVLLIGLSFGSCLHAQAPAGSTPAAAHVMGGFIMDMRMMSLYVFDNDKEAGVSTCRDACAATWPPFKAAATDKAVGAWTVIVREDGSRQWAYKGKPLYFFANDKAPGERKGDGQGSVWHAARP